MTTLRLEPSVVVELSEGPVAMPAPRYYPGGLAVDAGPVVDAARHDRFAGDETVGSVDFLSFTPVDEYRFDRAGSVLSRVSLTITEDQESDERRALSWLSVTATPGSIRLVEPTGEFTVMPAATRWSDDHTAGPRCAE